MRHRIGNVPHKIFSAGHQREQIIIDCLKGEIERLEKRGQRLAQMSGMVTRRPKDRVPLLCDKRR